MRKGEDLYDLIEDFHNGNLEGNELALFQERLKQDIQLQKKLEIYKLSRKLVIQNRLLDVKGILQAERLGGNRGKSGFGGKLILGISLLALIVGAVYFISIRKNEALIAVAVDKDTVKEIIYIPAPSDKNAKEVVEAPVKKQKSPKPSNNSDKVEIISDTLANSTSPVQSESMAVFQDKITLKDTVLPEKNEPQIFEVNRAEDQSEATRTPCTDLTINAKPRTTEPCFGEGNGEIYISISGGKSPYTFILNGNDKNTNGVFANLTAGKYNVEIIDSEGCIKNISEITLSGKNCRKNYQFNPFYGEKLEIPLYGKAGSISIFDKLGKLYFQKEFQLEEELFWDGKSNSGESRAGYFVFVIQFKDGTVAEGSITIAQ